MKYLLIVLFITFFSCNGINKTMSFRKKTPIVKNTVYKGNILAIKDTVEYIFKEFIKFKSGKICQFSDTVFYSKMFWKQIYQLENIDSLRVFYIDLQLNCSSFEDGYKDFEYIGILKNNKIMYYVDIDNEYDIDLDKYIVREDTLKIFGKSLQSVKVDNKHRLINVEKLIMQIPVKYLK